MSYLDEGPRDGEVVVMVHGNPSWSYYWRHLVAGLSGRYRCIVPDHVGMGLSDKPDDGGGVRPPADPDGARYDYTLRSRIDDLGALLRHAGIDDATPVPLADRKSVVEGKSGSVRVNLGGRRIIQKKTQKHTTT